YEKVDFLDASVMTDVFEFGEEDDAFPDGSRCGPRALGPTRGRSRLVRSGHRPSGPCQAGHFRCIQSRCLASGARSSRSIFAELRGLVRARLEVQSSAAGGDRAALVEGAGLPCSSIDESSSAARVGRKVVHDVAGGGGRRGFLPAMISLYFQPFFGFFRWRVQGRRRRPARRRRLAGWPPGCSRRRPTSSRNRLPNSHCNQRKL
ncbi:unnamed protein product, partial [Prorocentrum cordatum]